jgi:hypothetical protein
MPCRRTSASETATVLPGRPCRVPWFVGRPCDAGHVEPTARMLEDIPRGNLRVPRSEFAAVWAEAERLCDEEKRGGPGGGWYAAGVAHTCRWIAGASVVFNFPHGPRTQPAVSDEPCAARAQRAGRAGECDMTALRRPCVRGAGALSCRVPRGHADVRIVVGAELVTPELHPDGVRGTARAGVLRGRRVLPPQRWRCPPSAA